jgi:predicted ATPase
MLRRIRIENFKCLEDTKDLEVRPITFLVGPNSSGKSSVLQAISALEQTVKSGDQKSPLILRGDVDLGSYKDVVFEHDTKNNIKIHIEDSNSNKWSVVYSVQEKGRTAGQIFVESFEFEFSAKKDDTSFYAFVSKAKDNIATPPKLKIVREQNQSSYEIGFEGQESPSYKSFALNKFYVFSPTKFSTPPKGLKIVLLAGLYGKIESSIWELFTHIYSIGPLRNEPVRVYSASGASPDYVGKYGQWTIDMIQNDRDLRTKVKTWLGKFKISSDFSLKELKKGSERYEVVLRDCFTNTEVNLVDVGFGTSQILPIIVQGLISPENATLLIEQPEIHLHPRAQCVMGDLLVDIAKMNKRLIIETHSDILIERVCKHILYKDENEKINPEDVIIYYFEPTEKGTAIRTITVNENAQFENFPEGFFEERFEEALERAELME